MIKSLSGIANHPLIVVVGLISGLIATLAFLTGQESLCQMAEVPLLCAPRLPIRAYDPVADDAIACVTCAIEGWAALSAPGEREWVVEYPAGQAGFVSVGWCARDRRLLEQNWRNMDFILEFDGTPVEKSRLTLYHDDSGEQACNYYAGVVEGWPKGAHSFAWNHHIYQSVKDGWTSYEPGRYRMVYHVDGR